MRMHWMTAVVVGLLLGADAKDDVKKEKEKLQGTWKCVMLEEKGESKADTEDLRIVFDGDNFSVKRGDETMIKGTFKLDPSKNPKEVDLEVQGGIKAEGDIGKTAQGIYILKGDELKLCVLHPGGTDRPSEFSAPAGSERMFITLKREKS